MTSSEELIQRRAKIVRLTEVLTELCPTRQEALNVLMHVTAAALWLEVRGLKAPKDTEYVTSYLVKITKMLDGEFDRNSGTES